ncbi:hypothetical protein E2562_036889 [Oryza meyeriana var. granulata]|uniref:60S ribosomal protein L21 n=1 Tax=Oryza meyeriana var. granulata TaxID=110450 RepID=A0A6G1ETL7_9ORYZ|nr:hypothetical protein E2562_036889 [Oryza meyeriana var. granulata]
MGSAEAAVVISSDDEAIPVAGKLPNVPLELSLHPLPQDCNGVGEGLDDPAAFQEFLASMLDDKKSACDVAATDDGDDDDCVVLDGDPDKAVVVVNEERPGQGGPEEELQIVAEKGEKGYIPLTTYLCTYKIGDYVDVKVNGAVHKGMPHKFYHGRTGRVWNVTKRAIGVEINKQVGNRIIRKRIHVRVEHVQPSRCTEEFCLRKIKNDQLKADAKARGEVISTKRQPEGPKPGFMVEGATLETVTPIPYDVVNDLKGGY